MSFLGHIICQDDITVDPVKVQKLVELPIPRTLRELRAFIGLASYYRRLMTSFATISAPLYRLTKKGVHMSSWNSVRTEAFQSLKQSSVEKSWFKKSFTVYTDASDFRLGGILSQHDDDSNEYVICYTSTAMTSREKLHSN
jgi:hypothetical protein